MKTLLTFDYEVYFGARTGSVERCLLDPTDALARVAAKHGAPLAFFVDAGLLVPPRDVEALAGALTEALGDGPRRIAMGAAARMRARDNFSADVVVPAIERIWEVNAPDSKRTRPQELGIRNQELGCP